MVAQQQSSVYTDIVNVTTYYLGPAAERFVERQIETHLHKNPQSITKKDLSKLIEWITLAVVLLTSDDKTVREYKRALIKISKPRQPNSRKLPVNNTVHSKKPRNK